MKSLKILLSLSLVSTLVQAHSDGVVKIRSGICGSEEFTGSGVMFREQGELYVVSSEHVPALGPNLCNEAQSKSVEHIGLQLLRSDWGVGLALFKVKVNIGQIDVYSLNDFESSSLKSGENVLLGGFPALLSTPAFARGNIFAVTSDRHYFARILNVIEVHGEGEFGMSGGALLSFDRNKVHGILSNQILDKKEGMASEILPLEKNQRFNHIFVIAGGETKRWILEEALAPHSPSPIYTVDASARQNGQEVVSFSDFRFSLSTMVPGKLSASNDKGPPQGGQGVGIGGKDRDSTGIALSVTLNTLPSRSPTSPDAEWMPSLRQALLKNISLEIIGIQTTKERYALKSLSQFFALIERNPGSRPLYRVVNGMGVRNELSVNGQRTWQKFFQAAQTMKNAATDLQATSTQSGHAASLQMQNLIAKLQSFTEQALAASEISDASFIERRDFSELLSTPTWSEAFTLNCDAALSIKTALERLKELHGKLQPVDLAPDLEAKK